MYGRDSFFTVYNLGVDTQRQQQQQIRVADIWPKMAWFDTADC